MNINLIDIALYLICARRLNYSPHIRYVHIFYRYPSSTPTMNAKFLCSITHCLIRLSFIWLCKICQFYIARKQTKERLATGYANWYYLLDALVDLHRNGSYGGRSFRVSRGRKSRLSPYVKYNLIIDHIPTSFKLE